MTGDPDAHIEDLCARIDADGRPVAAIFRSALFNPSETFVAMQAAGLRRYQPLVIGLHDRANRPDALVGRLWVPGRAMAFTIKLSGRSGWFADALPAIRPVLVHAHFAQDGLLALPLARRWNVPLITSLRGHDVTRSRRAMLLSGRVSWMRYALWRRALIDKGDAFLAVADSLRDHAIAQGYPAERTITHYNGVDHARFGPRIVQPGLVLHVGRLVGKKGTAVLIAAFAAARRKVPAAELVIVGDGPMLAALRQQAADAGIASAVRFLGHQPPAVVVQWMAKAALVAVPSFTASDGDSEGLPNVALEAAAAGAPVVATRHGGLAEAVIDGKSGLLVDEGDVRGLKEAMVRLLENPALAEAMGAAGRTWVRQRFDLAHQMARLEEIYDAVREGRLRPDGSRGDR